MNAIISSPAVKRSFYLLAIAVVIGLLVLADLLASYLWFAALELTRVFWTLRLLKVGLFSGSFLLIFIYFWLNLRILARQLNPAATSGAGTLTWSLSRHAGATGSAQHAATQSGSRAPNFRVAIRYLLMVVAAAGALLIAGIVSAYWDTLLRFYWAQPYGATEPVYGRDIGFYLFRLPFYELLQNTLTGMTFIATAVLSLIYINADAIRLAGLGAIATTPAIRRHLAVNLALFAIALAWGYYLDRYQLLLEGGGIVYGAGYSDVHIMRPALWVAVASTLLLGMLPLSSRINRSAMRLSSVLGGYLTVMILATGVIPWAVQQYLVEPNELELEQPYLQQNIAFTRRAYALDRIDERIYATAQTLTPAAISQNQPTIENIRLWDWHPLSQTFRQLQRIRTYYDFGDVDVDRYRLDGRDRQVMLSVRELAENLPDKADTWVNRHLQYTHGYGLAMSLTAEKDTQGSPLFVVRDLPPQAEGGLQVSQPAIYYGEKATAYSIVDSGVEEFDYPHGDGNRYTHYGGHGGILLDSFWKKLLFAWQQFDLNILITGYLTPHSRIQLWRGVHERIARIAPFLRLDDDPYPVLSDGRLYWVQDAYTTAASFPYSEPDQNGFNYIRNSVKVIVDAYQGSVDFYVIDNDDPLLKAYRQALPGLFKELKEMPETLRRHLRYPKDLFRAQVVKYSTYHMTLPQVFYNKEDLWSSPREKYGDEVITMEPYYVLMQLPQEQHLQFLLMTPLTPRARDNMIAWMAARSDFPGYGELLVYKLPKDRLILGPIQIEAMIDQDTLVSQQLSLWDQRGSRVIRGNLLVIPLDHSFIYVEPVYLIAEDTDIPQLKRIIVSDGEKLAMEPTLEQALQSVFGTGTQITQQQPANPQAGGEGQDLSEARQALSEAEKALADGEWNKFGEAMQRLKQLLGPDR